MLQARHFDEFASPKRTWDELVADGTVVSCRSCSKWIYSRWYKGDYDPALKKFGEYKMDKCALCFFHQ